MPGKFDVTCQYIGGVKMYAVYRLRDANGIDHSGNREYVTDYMPDKAEAEEICSRLNALSEDELARALQEGNT